MLPGLCFRFRTSPRCFPGGIHAPRDGTGSATGSRSRMRAEPRLRPRHHVEHVVPTVIHDPEEKMGVLARWVRHTMANPTRFWSLIALVVLVVVGLSLLSSG